MHDGSRVPGTEDDCMLIWLCVAKHRALPEENRKEYFGSVRIPARACPQ
jgi:hypothetical protein